jgi:hypothetical protein
VTSVSVVQLRAELGQRFGRWLVLDAERRMPPRPTRPTRPGDRAALVLCDCGVSRLVALWNLTAGRSKSCGCLDRELSAERMRARAAARVAA